jgi:hypothetical protein
MRACSQRMSRTILVTTYPRPTLRLHRSVPLMLTSYSFICRHPSASRGRDERPILLQPTGLTDACHHNVSYAASVLQQKLSNRHMLQVEPCLSANQPQQHAGGQHWHQGSCTVVRTSTSTQTT